MFTGNGSISFAFKEKNRLENRRSLLDNSRMFEAAVLMGILLSGRIFEINLYTTGVYRGFFEMLQLVNCNLIKSCFTRNLRQCHKVEL